MKKRLQILVAPRWISTLILIAGTGLLASSARPAGELTEAPTPGTLLIARRSLQDPNFRHTVVLLVETGSSGAMGVIVNRPTPIPVAEALHELVPQLEIELPRGEVLYRGGPVLPLAPLFLADRAGPREGSKEVVPGQVYLLTSLEAVAKASKADKVRAIAGYAGWGPGQLENELARSDWHQLPGEGRWVFSDDPRGLWAKLLEIVSLPIA